MKRQNLITRERFLKGDLQVARDAAGYINNASVEDRTILNYLFTNKYLDYRHVEAAATYSGWQYTFNRPFNPEPRKVYLIELAGYALGKDDAETAYRRLLRKLSRLDQGLVEKAITQDVSADTKAEVYGCRHLYRITFDILDREIDGIIDFLSCNEQEPALP